MEATTANIALSGSRCGVKPRHKIVKLYTTPWDWLICSPGIDLIAATLNSPRCGSRAYGAHCAYHEVHVANHLHKTTKQTIISHNSYSNVKPRLHLTNHILNLQQLPDSCMIYSNDNISYSYVTIQY